MIVLSFIVWFYMIVGQACNTTQCGSVLDQKACEFLWGGDQGPVCLWKLGPSPACVSDFNQCDILGDFCHLDPACFINAEGKCVADPCIESANDGNSCSNTYCIPRVMYDYDNGADTFYNFTMCTSPQNVPNACYYLSFYEHNSNNTYTFRNDVCGKYPSICKQIVVNSPYMSGNYCTDGRQDLCENILDQDACKLHKGVGKDCVFRLGSPPSCVQSYDQCSVLGTSYCHLYPSCFVNDEGKCVSDPCAEELPGIGQSCSNEYCVPHVMYDYNGTNSSFYQWTLCTHPKNTPNTCYYLAHYDSGSSGSFIYNSSVCTHQSSCQNVEYNTPAFSGHYCTDGREGELVVSASQGDSNDGKDDENWSVVKKLLVAILVIVIVGVVVVGIVVILIGIVIGRGSSASKKEEVESANIQQWHSQKAESEPLNVSGTSPRPSPNFDDNNMVVNPEKKLLPAKESLQPNVVDIDMDVGFTAPRNLPPSQTSISIGESKTRSRGRSAPAVDTSVEADYPDTVVSPKSVTVVPASRLKSKKAGKKKAGKNRNVALVEDSS